ALNAKPRDTRSLRDDPPRPKLSPASDTLCRSHHCSQVPGSHTLRYIRARTAFPRKLRVEDQETRLALPPARLKRITPRCRELQNCARRNHTAGVRRRRSRIRRANIWADSGGALVFLAIAYMLFR